VGLLNLPLEAVQIRFSHLTRDRSCCPVDPTHKIHRHGHSHRYGDCDGLEPLERILRFLCRLFLAAFMEAGECAVAILEDAADYERIVLLFDGEDPDAVADARTRWSAAKENGFAVTYWQPDEQGRWQRKA
jgi:hypothetical protein